MKITLFPTAPGCHRPLQVMQTAQAYLDAGKRIAMSTNENPKTMASPFMRIEWVGSWDRFPALAPQLVIVDNLLFIDLDGLRIGRAREGFPDPDRGDVKGSVLRKILDDLEKAGTEEVLLVSEVLGVSPAWKAELDAWGVEIAWEQAAASPWRTWKSSVEAPRLFEPGGEKAGIAIEIHSAVSQVFLTLAAEFSDLQYGRPDPHCPRAEKRYREIFRVLEWLLRGQPEDRTRQICGKVRDHLALLSYLVEAFVGSKSEDIPGSGRKIAPPRTPSHKTLH